MGVSSRAYESHHFPLGGKHLIILAICLAWLFFYFQSTAFLMLLFFPIVSVLVLSVWRRTGAWPLFDPVGVSFVVALSVCSLTATAYSLVFDRIFLNLIAFIPILSVVPVFLLFVLFLGIYGFLSIRSLEKNTPAITESVFFVSQLVAVMVAAVIVVAIPMLGVIG